MKFTREQWEKIRPAQQDWWIETTAIHAGLLKSRMLCPYRFTVLHEHCDQLVQALDVEDKAEYCWAIEKILGILGANHPNWEDSFALVTATTKQKALALAVTLGLTEL